MHIAAKVRLEKEQHPERFCRDASCLWRIAKRAGPQPCPYHPAPVEQPVPAICGRCGASTDFELDPVEGLVSTCCTARPMNVEAPGYMEDR